MYDNIHNFHAGPPFKSLLICLLQAPPELVYVAGIPIQMSSDREYLLSAIDNPHAFFLGARLHSEDAIIEATGRKGLGGIGYRLLKVKFRPAKGWIPNHEDQELAVDRAMLTEKILTK